MKLFRDGKVWTIPNILSAFRLLLVPFIVWAYLGPRDVTLTIVLLAISALTDVLDGRIARRFHMVSDLGKALDPLADKLTQFSVVLCLALSHPFMWVLLGLVLIREPTMGVLGYITIRKTGKVPGARWYGKVSTIALYTSALAILVFPEMPEWLTTGLIVFCSICVTGALALYTRYYLRVWNQTEAVK